MADKLVEEVLEMARKGVHRQELLDSCDGTKAQISQAIAKARMCGLYSIADMNDFRKGTYYQYDPPD